MRHEQVRACNHGGTIKKHADMSVADLQRTLISAKLSVSSPTLLCTRKRMPSACKCESFTPFKEG